MILVSDIKHPKEFSSGTGRTAVVKEIDAINQSIRLLLTTAKGECFGDPNFGCNLYSYLYEFEGDALNQMIKGDIVQTLTEQDNRVDVSDSDITIDDEGTTLQINIAYRVRYTNYSSQYSLLIQKRKDEEVI